ncbi:mannose-1-phosphate guanylyltransferase/mannose-6-phosphate isomerase [Rhodomicrobium sp. Az07]|uniref:mannose-1-phosphate guanylyltransferase/mannose-6-phosphate isomerase n=1 Tax=Rhodomicrobium sp. Az07 TaxID=2839034 RepID=UPI001BEA5CF2|nr:mannose-1-phosphate guanylyltransferase/mannose-6-phosphate isomerase [Rhodomicrobium sp. Az07]MBT3070264.1 mannose-1-phosphate guanylyltransferase/mannose-6-phosphate isomerase [Rhodomicrobium sp. Az07]
MIIPVILAGGSGSRLWPLSRSKHPKQFHALVSAEPLLVDAARRVPGSGAFMPPFVITNEENRFGVVAAFRNAKLACQGIVLEPEGRSTAPAAAVAAHLALEKAGPDALILIMPSDHHIENPRAFLDAVEAGRTAARNGLLVTFGIKPTKPETGYGYVKTAAAADGSGAVLKVDRFVEKPDRATAERFCAEDLYFWNSGIFLFGARAYLDELARFEPAMAEASLDAVQNATADPMNFIRLADSFRECPADSIDYAVMEKTDKAALVPLDAGWSDVGTWDALYDAAEKDERENATRGDVLLRDASRCYVRAESGLVAVSGVEDIVVISTKDATLVAKRTESGSVKEVVQQLAATRRNEAEQHTTVHRPWGSYETLHLSDRYQVKQIVVEPGAALSLQRHHHRAEHWIVVKGTARVTIDDETRLLSENQSIYVPLGSTHRLENPGLIPLTLIEVQSGPYLGEDDIVRLEDVYARV